MHGALTRWLGLLLMRAGEDAERCRSYHVSARERLQELKGEPEGQKA